MTFDFRELLLASSASSDWPAGSSSCLICIGAFLGDVDRSVVWIFLIGADLGLDIIFLVAARFSSTISHGAACDIGSLPFSELESDSDVELEIES